VSVRLMVVLLAALAVGGCVTTQSKVSPVNELQGQVTELSSRVEAQEKEIVDLKYNLKEMADKAETKEWDTAQEKSAAVAKSSTTAVIKISSDKDSNGIIKVGASAEQVQKALKNAGVYEGAVDGKIGSKTKVAIAEFQKQHNLRADGVIGQKTWNEMKQYLSE